MGQVDSDDKAREVVWVVGLNDGTRVRICDMTREQRSQWRAEVRERLAERQHKAA